MTRPCFLICAVSLVVLLASIPLANATGLERCSMELVQADCSAVVGLAQAQATLYVRVDNEFCALAPNPKDDMCGAYRLLDEASLTLSEKTTVGGVVTWQDVPASVTRLQACTDPSALFQVKAALLKANTQYRLFGNSVMNCQLEITTCPTTPASPASGTCDVKLSDSTQSSGTQNLDVQSPDDIDQGCSVGGGHGVGVLPLLLGVLFLRFRRRVGARRLAREARC